MFHCKWCILKNAFKRCVSTEGGRTPLKQNDPSSTLDVASSSKKRSHSFKINAFFRKNPNLVNVREYIPEKYFSLKRSTPPENLYLIDNEVAQKAASYIAPDVKHLTDHIVCETSAGLGLTTHHLLNNGVDLVRLYESCPDFRAHLIRYFENYPRRVEIFNKNIFLLSRYEYIDLQDRGNRVEQLLNGVPKKSWMDDPAMTIIGALPNMNFIQFLLKSFVLQSHIMCFGRIQVYAFMRPRDCIILTAGPHLNLHTYRRWSVLFRLLFDLEVLDKFPRQVFLPWVSQGAKRVPRYPDRVDPDLMYFVRINFKKELPVSLDNLLPLYTFVTQFFGSGSKRIIPVLEKWVPGAGLDIMIPKLKHREYFQNINIFTQFRELTPNQILAVFEEMSTHSEYKRSHFISIIESHLIKTETIESNLDDHLEKSIVENIEVK